MSLDLLTESSAAGNLSLLLLLAKATVILVAALGVTFAMQRSSAGARHLVWLVAIGALLFLPVLASWSPLRLEVLPSALADRTPVTPSSRVDAATIESPAQPRAASRETFAPSGDARGNAGGNARGSVTPIAEAPAPLDGNGTLLDKAMTGAVRLVALWAAVAILFAGWLAYGALSVRRIVRRATPLDTRDWVTPLWEISDRFGLEEPPRLLRSRDAKMPFASGLAQPTIVLPAECDTWTLDRRRAVLLHELAHVRRRDLLGHTLGRFACAIYWFHPLVWTAAKRLRAESERACDDLALTCGARASDYAEHLLDIVTCVGRHTTPAVAMAMARRKEFEGRMLAILDPELRRAAPSRRESVGLVGALVVLSVVVGAAAPARAADGTTLTAGAATRPATDRTVLSDRVPSETLRTENNARTANDTRTVAATRRFDSARTSDVAGERTPSAPARNSANPVQPESVVSTSVTIEQLTAAAQGRGDERPKLLANVLRTDTSAALRRVAAWGLSNYARTDVAAEALATAVRRDANASVREMAAWALGNGDNGDTAVTEALTAALRRDADVKVRGTAAWALGNIGDRDAVTALAEALVDTSASVRMRSAWALGNLNPREAPSALINMLGDREPNARTLAAWALYNIRDPKAVDALDAALRKETEKEVQYAFIRALAATGEESIEAIKRLIDSKDAEVRSVAIRALAGGRATGPWPWPWPEPRPHAW